MFIYLLIVARRAVDELDDDDDNENSLPIDGRSRSSSNVEGHSGYQGIPEGRTSMAEYRPLSAGLTSISIVRPTPDFKTSRELNSKMSMEETGFASENMHSPNMMMSGGRKSMNLNGSMVQRQVFERQNTTTTMTTASTFGESRSYDIELPPSYDRRWSIERENKERTAHGSERKGLLLDDGDDDDVEKDEEDEVRNGSVVDPLESIAYDRSQQRK